MGYEETIMTMIVKSGEAKSCCMRAIAAARVENYVEADRLLEDASDYLAGAHLLQTGLLSEEANGNVHEITLLMIHAQDHLMNTMTVKDLGSEMIAMMKDRK